MMSEACRVLVIDDSANDRADMRQMLLRGSGRRYQFTDADLGTTGLQLIRDAQAAVPGRVPFDCVLLDFHLPDIDAHKMLAALCDGCTRTPCPVLVITGWAGVDSADGSRLMRAGAQDFIGKSWTTPASLTRAVENAIERYALMAQRELEAISLADSERQLQAQATTLAEQDRRKDEFLAMLSHELRNPLAPICNALQLLQLQENQDPVQQQAHAIIERQVTQLNHLVGELLEISRITTGRLVMRKEPVAFNRVIEQAVETVQPLIAQYRHQLAVALPPQPVWLLADAVRLEQVIVNLLTNAAKFTNPGGAIALAVRREGDSVVLTVRDNGIGIAADLLPHIFQMFTQGERSIDRAQGGLGIGLCLVQRLVELHNGTVEASSVVDQGSEFSLRLPCADAPPHAPPHASPHAPATAATLPQATPAAQRLHRVLVVDDNRDAADSLASLLAFNGHEVRLAYDGPTALALAIEFQPDAVSLDIGLPGLDGYETARQIRQQHALQHTVLIALTGYGQEADRERSRQAGFDHHLVKPADFDELENLLNGTGSAAPRD